MQNSLNQLNEAKDTFQKSADYLRETLKTTEKSLEEIKAELAQEQEKVKELEKEQVALKESHRSELEKRSESYGVVSERNKELEGKVSSAQSEIGKLSEWISRLERVSGEGNAMELLRKELEEASAQVLSLREELSSKRPRSWW